LPSSEGEKEPAVEKGLAVLMGMLAVLFAAPAFAQGFSPPAGPVDFGEGDGTFSAGASFEGSGEEPPEIESEVEATGYLSPVYPRNVYSHLLNDETTGATYFARSEEINLDSYDGQRITVRGTLSAVEEYPDPILEVTGVESAEDTTSDETATLGFELAVQGDSPADATFFGTVRGEGLRYVPLMDPDEDGVYTGSTPVARFAPGTRPLPPETEPVSLPVQIVQGTGTRGSPDESDSLRPGEPIRTIKDFGPVRAEDKTLSASISFGGNQGGSTTPDSDYDSSSGGDNADGTRSLLPGASGVVLTLGVVALLVAGGFLIRRLAR
jgi:hypothetical protein